jgi:hypothetical protein
VTVLRRESAKILVPVFHGIATEIVARQDPQRPACRFA